MNDEGRGSVAFDYEVMSQGDAVAPLAVEMQALVEGRPADAFAWLGPHADGNGGRVIRALVPFGTDMAGQLLIADLLAMRFRTLGVPKDPACPGCAAELCAP